MQKVGRNPMTERAKKDLASYLQKQDEVRRSRRAEARYKAAQGTGVERFALQLAEAGYGVDTLRARTGCSRALALLLVLGETE